MGKMKFYLRVWGLCAACVLAAACSSSEDKNERIVLGTPSVIAEMPPVTEAPVKVEDLDVTPIAVPETPAVQPPQTPAAPAQPAAQASAAAKTPRKFTFGRRYEAFKQESADLTDRAKKDLRH